MNLSGAWNATKRAARGMVLPSLVVGAGFVGYKATQKYAMDRRGRPGNPKYPKTTAAVIGAAVTTAAYLPIRKWKRPYPRTIIPIALGVGAAVALNKYVTGDPQLMREHPRALPIAGAQIAAAALGAGLYYGGRANRFRQAHPLLQGAATLAGSLALLNYASSDDAPWPLSYLGGDRQTDYSGFSNIERAPSRTLDVDGTINFGMHNRR